MISNFIHGQKVAAADGRTTDLIDPSTGEVYATAPLSRQADIDAAFDDSARAFESWRDTTPSERQRALLKIAESPDSSDACSAASPGMSRTSANTRSTPRAAARC